MPITAMLQPARLLPRHDGSLFPNSQEKWSSSVSLNPRETIPFRDDARLFPRVVGPMARMQHAEVPHSRMSAEQAAV